MRQVFAAFGDCRDFAATFGGCWRRIFECRRSGATPARLTPFKCTLPTSAKGGCKVPAIAESSEDLPHPEGPISITISPCSTLRLKGAIRLRPFRVTANSVSTKLMLVSSAGDQTMRQWRRPREAAPSGVKQTLLSTNDCPQKPALQLQSAAW